jgi:hypothetical protein
MNKIKILTDTTKETRNEARRSPTTDIAHNTKGFLPIFLFFLRRLIHEPRIKPKINKGKNIVS